MTGKDILKNENLAQAYDEAEAIAISKLDEVFGEEEIEITDEQSDRYETIADYKYNAQSFIQTADLYLQRLKEL